MRRKKELLAVKSAASIAIFQYFGTSYQAGYYKNFFTRAIKEVKSADASSHE